MRFHSARLLMDRCVWSHGTGLLVCTKLLCCAALFLCAMLLSCCSGCSLTGPRAPVPQDVADCRKLSQRAVGALQRGDLVTAQSLSQRAVRINPTDAQAQHYYSEALWQSGQFTAAVSAAEEAWKLNRDDPLLAVKLGEQRLELGAAQVAEQHANEAIELCPNCSAAWALRARARVIQDQPDAALSDYQRALAYQPRDQRLLLEVAELQRRLNRPQRALAMLDSLRETYAPGEEPPQLFVLESQALTALERYDDALRVCSELTRRLPSASSWQALAEAQQRAGQQSAAEFSLAQASLLQQQESLENSQNQQRFAETRRGDWKR